VDGNDTPSGKVKTLSSCPVQTYGPRPGPSVLVLSIRVIPVASTAYREVAFKGVKVRGTGKLKTARGKVRPEGARISPRHRRCP